jgi:hypothetical protein
VAGTPHPALTTMLLPFGHAGLVLVLLALAPDRLVGS